MDKQDFLDRLANPERYEILEWFKHFEAVVAGAFPDITYQQWELVPGQHRIKLESPRYSTVYEFISAINKRFPEKKYNGKNIEIIETDDNIWFIYQINEKNHIQI